MWVCQKLGWSELQAIRLPGEHQALPRGKQTKPVQTFQLKLLVNASWYFMAEIKQPCSTPELPFPGPWPVNTSSLAAAWPAVEQALNESCWPCSVKNPKLEPEGPCEALPAYHTFPWFDFCRSHGGFVQENSAGTSFAAYYLAHIFDVRKTTARK